jgi:hypothetical protein
MSIMESPDGYAAIPDSVSTGSIRRFARPAALLLSVSALVVIGAPSHGKWSGAVGDPQQRDVAVAEGSGGAAVDAARLETAAAGAAAAPRHFVSGSGNYTTYSAASNGTLGGTCNSGTMTFHYSSTEYAAGRIALYLEHLFRQKIVDTSVMLAFNTYDSNDALARGALNGDFCPGDIVHVQAATTCDYIWSDTDPLLQTDQTHFRAVLNYSRPLQIFWTDSACRMSAPATHHKVYRAGTAHNLSAAAGNPPLPWGLSETCLEKQATLNKSLAFNVRAEQYYRRPDRSAAAKVRTKKGPHARATVRISRKDLSARTWDAQDNDDARDAPSPRPPSRRTHTTAARAGRVRRPLPPLTADARRPLARVVPSSAALSLARSPLAPRARSLARSFSSVRR